MKKLWAIVGVILGVVFVGVVGITLFCIYIPTPRTLDGATLTIETGMNTSALAKQLKTQKFISSEWVFVWYMRLSGRAGQIKAGDHTIPQRANMIDIVSEITDGANTGLGYGDVHVTIIEGWDSDEVLAALQKQGLPADGVDAWYAEMQRTRQTELDITFDGKDAAQDLTGYLYPDTYFFKKDATAETIIGTMFDNFERHMTTQRQEAARNSTLSFYEILILASIVEKEVSSDEDRAVVAGIFIQRYKDQYPLQSDATVNFVTKKNTTRPNAEDLKTDSLYNTYKHGGLPPGPICNPSVSAIDAVLNPTMTDYYFFLTTKDGRTIFSTTYQEHLKATQTYYGN